MNLRAIAILTTAASLLPTALAVDDGEDNINNSIRGASSFLSSTLSNDVTPRQQGLRQLAPPCQCRPDKGKYCCENGETCTSSGCVNPSPSPPPPSPPTGTCPSCILNDFCNVCSSDWSTSTLECTGVMAEPKSALTGYKSSTTINGFTVTIDNPYSDYACNDGTGGYYRGDTCRLGGSMNQFGAKCCPSGQVYAGNLLNCIPVACDETVTPGECDDGGGGPTGVITPQPTSSPTQAVVSPQPTSAPTKAVITPNPTPACSGAGGLCKGKGALPCCSGFTCNRDKVCESISSDESLPWVP